MSRPDTLIKKELSLRRNYSVVASLCLVSILVTTIGYFVFYVPRQQINDNQILTHEKIIGLQNFTIIECPNKNKTEDLCGNYCYNLGFDAYNDMIVPTRVANIECKLDDFRCLNNESIWFNEAKKETKYVYFDQSDPFNFSFNRYDLTPFKYVNYVASGIGAFSLIYFAVTIWRISSFKRRNTRLYMDPSNLTYSAIY